MPSCAARKPYRPPRWRTGRSATDERGKLAICPHALAARRINPIPTTRGGLLPAGAVRKRGWRRLSRPNPAAMERTETDRLRLQRLGKTPAAGRKQPTAHRAIHLSLPIRTTAGRPGRRKFARARARANARTGLAGRFIQPRLRPGTNPARYRKALPARRRQLGLDGNAPQSSPATARKPATVGPALAAGQTTRAGPTATPRTDRTSGSTAGRRQPGRKPGASLENHPQPELAALRPQRAHPAHRARPAAAQRRPQDPRVPALLRTDAAPAPCWPAVAGGANAGNRAGSGHLRPVEGWAAPAASGARPTDRVRAAGGSG